MNKRYIELFRTLAQSMEVAAETVMEYNHEKADEQGEKTATVMRQDYQELNDRLQADDYIITKSDCAKLLVGALIITGQLQDKINNTKKALAGYQTDLMPKLQELLDKTSEEEWENKVNELFEINE